MCFKVCEQILKALNGNILLNSDSFEVKTVISFRFPAVQHFETDQLQLDQSMIHDTEEVKQQETPTYVIVASSEKKDRDQLKEILIENF